MSTTVLFLLGTSIEHSPTKLFGVVDRLGEEALPAREEGLAKVRRRNAEPTLVNNGNRPLELGNIANGSPLVAKAIAVLLASHLALVHNSQLVSSACLPDAKVRVVGSREDETVVESVERRENTGKEMEVERSATAGKASATDLTHRCMRLVW